jgi:ubiquinone/menaquinone biosynthesis C-methylase UbiE
VTTEHDAAAYGDAFADVYDRWYHDVTDAEGTARFVADRCPPGLPVVELGVGTGRLVGPLLTYGLTVIGVDASAPMLAQCHRRRFGPGLHLVRADMAHLPLRGPVGVVLIAFNTLFNLPTARGQQSVFDRAAHVLAPDGALIVETLDPGAFDRRAGTSIGVREPTAAGVTVVATDVDPAAQTITGHHVEISHRGVHVRPWHLRWAGTRELDRFGTAAGLTLTERHAGWSAGGSPTGDSAAGGQERPAGTRSPGHDAPESTATVGERGTESTGGGVHISVYQPPGAGVTRSAPS